MKKFLHLILLLAILFSVSTTTIVCAEEAEEGECVAGECSSPEAEGEVPSDQNTIEEDSGVTDSSEEDGAAVQDDKVEEAPSEPTDTSPQTETTPENDSSDSQTTTSTSDISKTCPDRDHLMRCAAEYLDSNKNGKLDRSELQDAISGLPWYSRVFLNILGSVDKMMQKCDVDKDDAISIDYDMEHNKESCLATCFKRRAFKAAFFSDCDL